MRRVFRLCVPHLMVAVASVLTAVAGSARADLVFAYQG
jgi:hypothetical protein